MGKFLLGVLATVVVGLVAALTVIWSGLFNVAANDAENPVLAWAFDATFENSVRRQAKDIVVPASFTDAQLEAGFRSFDAMCVACHGGPGVASTEWFEGLRPIPPQLAEESTGWNTAELFWIVRNGVKMTGMPSFGATHDDEEIWSMVAFLEALPSLGEAEYAALREELGPAEGHGEAAGEEAAGEPETAAPEAAGPGAPARDAGGEASVIMEPPTLEQ